MTVAVQRHTNHLVSHSYRLVPRTVLGSKNVSSILRRKFIRLVERDLQRGIMRLQQHIRHNRFILQLRMLPCMSRILMTPDVPPWPAIKSALLHMRDVIRHEVVAERVTLVHRAPQLPGPRIHADPSTGIANAIGIDLELAVRWVARQD